MKDFLLYLWKYHDGLVVWSPLPFIAFFLIIIGSFNDKEFDQTSIFGVIVILTIQLWLWWGAYKEYKKYYHNDRYSNLNKTSEENVVTYEYVTPFTYDGKVQDVTTSNSVKIESPEKFFSTPRKIDWDTLNKTRKYNGDLGEIFVYDLEKNYLTKIGRSDLAKKVKFVSKEGDGHGYDIRSFYESGVEKFIEVKATNASSGSTFNISKNEFQFLQTHLDNTLVYHVHNIDNEHETTVTVYPANAVINSPYISPSGYVVKM